MNEGQEGMVILDKTPFYPEMGGQIGDTGVLKNEHQLFRVTNCQSPYKGVIAHIGHLEKGTLQLGNRITASLDAMRRQKIANNHTATHLLHWALQKILGEHVKQAGSVVEPARLRFDFSHHKALTSDEIRQIEDLVNVKIRENLPVKWYEIPYEEAQKHSEIKQFFGEKYDSLVRVIDIDYSKELCGGTHTSALGNIGLFRIAKESSIAAGIRRIEAVTGPEAEAFCRQYEDLLNQLAQSLKIQPQKVTERIAKLVEENKHYTQELKELKKAQREELIDASLLKLEKIREVPFLSIQLHILPEDVKTITDEIMEKMQSGVLVVGNVAENRCQIIVRVTDDLVKKGINANDMIKQIAPIIEGSGGGKANTAQAGGQAPQNIPKALQKAREQIYEI
jgi:alanyl-tRNA synthetase